MPRSQNLSSKAPRPGNVDLYKKMMSKRSFFERGSRILESRCPGLGEVGGKMPRSRNLGPGMSRPVDVDLYKRMISKI